MKRSLLFVLMAAALAAPAWSQEDHCTPTPKESAQVSGPHGLEGWTLESALPDSQYGKECFSATLVLARNGRVIRKIEAGDLIRNWIFWNEGRQVAIEEGVLHFRAEFVLKDVKTGRTIGTCISYHGLPKDVPDWVTAVAE